VTSETESVLKFLLSMSCVAVDALRYLEFSSMAVEAGLVTVSTIWYLRKP